MNDYDVIVISGECSTARASFEDGFDLPWAGPFPRRVEGLLV
jgi:hypothetical protein